MLFLSVPASSFFSFVNCSSISAFSFLLISLASFLMFPILTSEFPSIYIGDFTQLYVDPALHSFPSGHAADVWTGATILFVVAKQVSLKFSLILVAILVSLSRVTLGAHYPIDILVGSLVGLLTGSLCLVISRTSSNKI